jgi:hypothetical protein
MYESFGPQPNFRASSLAIIELADEICTDYRRRGFNLTLRQLYYQFISRDAFPNDERNYKRLGSIVNDARLAGMIDWSHIEDRGREAHDVHWLGHVPPEMSTAVDGLKYYHSLDLWEGQDYRFEVWVEKQALEEVAERAVRGYRSGYFACKGYVSQSEMYAAGQRLRNVISEGQTPIILHLGDHDPSGIDMTRDIGDRLSMFAGDEIEVRRLALNMPQIRALNPPPNPAKLTDSRSDSYVAKYGTSSWELDAVSPEQLVTIVRREIEKLIDRDLFDEKVAEEEQGREVYEKLSVNWDEIRELAEQAGLM